MSPLDALDDGHLQDVDRAADAGEQGRTRGERLQKRISLGRAERPPARQVIRGRDHVGRVQHVVCAEHHVDIRQHARLCTCKRRVRQADHDHQREAAHGSIAVFSRCTAQRYETKR
ncbi:MAG: hypothetical protein AUH72_06040 [Acidobacteria bacterium 13_1_40CM_4_65_8]|nr:MAG: hypothetical protein AUH72_06040 [Acidobacteria bacterium 13_1_40CM_4_65_8]